MTATKQAAKAAPKAEAPKQTAPVAVAPKTEAKVEKVKRGKALRCPTCRHALKEVDGNYVCQRCNITWKLTVVEGKLPF